jgi:hypothetical protein
MDRTMNTTTVRRTSAALTLMLAAVAGATTNAFAVDT